MTRLDPTTGTFTSVHVSFIHLCLETRSYAAAEPILDNYIHTLPAKIPSAVREGLEYSVPCADVASSGEYIHQNSGHTDRVGLADIQEYYVLGAMAYLGLRQFKKAKHFVEHVLVVPSANTANGLMLEAYKKWVLLSCLVGGKVRFVGEETGKRQLTRTDGEYTTDGECDSDEEYQGGMQGVRGVGRGVRRAGQHVQVEGTGASWHRDLGRGKTMKQDLKRCSVKFQKALTKYAGRQRGTG